MLAKVDGEEIVEKDLMSRGEKSKYQVEEGNSSGTH